MSTTRPTVPTSTVATTPAGASARSRPSLLRFVLAGLLVVAGALAALLLLGTGGTAVTASLQAAAQGPASGVAVTAHPDTWFVYTLEGAPVADIALTAADGTALPVTPADEGFVWGPHREGLQVGTFEVPVGVGLAGYRVAATPTAGAGETTLAVTTFDAVRWGRLVAWGAGVLVAVNVGVAVALVVLWAPGRRRKSLHRPTPPA